jgi:hypothetical protein
MRTILIAAVAALSLSACRGATDPTNGGREYESLPADQVMIGVDHAMTLGGVRQSLLRTDTTLIFDDSATIQLRVVDLEIYDEAGQVRATLTSTSGELNRNTNKMVARGVAGCMEQPDHRGCVKLTVRGAQGRVVWTQELHYDPQQKRVWSDVRTRSRSDNGQDVTFASFTSDDQFRNFSGQRPSGTGIRIEF